MLISTDSCHDVKVTKIIVPCKSRSSATAQHTLNYSPQLCGFSSRGRCSVLCVICVYLQECLINTFHVLHLCMYKQVCLVVTSMSAFYVGSASKFKKLTDRLQVAMLSPYDSGHDSPETPSIASEELLQVIKSDSHSPVACRRKGGSTGSGNTPTKSSHEYANMLDSSDDPDSDEGILDLPKK